MNRLTFLFYLLLGFVLLTMLSILAFEFWLLAKATHPLFAVVIFGIVLPYAAISTKKTYEQKLGMKMPWRDFLPFKLC